MFVNPPPAPTISGEPAPTCNGPRLEGSKTVPGFWLLHPFFTNTLLTPGGAVAVCAVNQDMLLLPRPRRLKLRKFWIVLISTALIALTGFIPVRLAITLHRVPIPQAILVLGGDVRRMSFAAEFWRSHPNLEIWVSEDRQVMNYLKIFFQRAGIPERQIHYDICATDTVTNFTCTVQDFAVREISHLYLITSDYHIARALAIATIVLGSRGIAVTPLSVPSEGQPPDSLLRIVRDCVRSALWIATGRTGARFNPRLHSATLYNLN